MPEARGQSRFRLKRAKCWKPVLNSNQPPLGVLGESRDQGLDGGESSSKHRERLPHRLNSLSQHLLDHFGHHTWPPPRLRAVSGGSHSLARGHVHLLRLVPLLLPLSRPHRVAYSASHTISPVYAPRYVQIAPTTDTRRSMFLLPVRSAPSRPACVQMLPVQLLEPL